jgi:uncharacterized membrane protein
VSRTRKALAGFWIFGGIMHFVIPRSYEKTVPPQVPMTPKQAVAISGVAEIGLGLAVLEERTLPVARWGILALLAAVYPANIYMALKPEATGVKDVPRQLLWARLPLQFLFAWHAWKGTEPAGGADPR